MNAAVTGGIGRVFLKRSNVVGVGVNWGSPSQSGLRDQYTTEFFYRFQLAQNFSITPSLQWLVDPALNPDTNSIWLFGLRTRLTL